MYRRSLIWTFIIIMVIGSLSASATDVSETLEMINYYLDLIRSGNDESAIMFWDQSSLAMSNRLGIQLRDSEFKIDCNSPILADRDGLYDAGKYNLGSQVRLPEGAVRWRVRSATISPSIRFRTNYYYYAVKSGNDYWLTTPYRYYSSDWTTVDSKYFRFFLHPKAENRYNRFAADELDKFVETTASRLNMPDSSLQKLADEKIYYYLCPNQIEVKKLCGYERDAYFDQSVDAITSDGMSAHSAVALELFNLKLGTIDFSVLQSYQYGLATMLGGQSIRNPEVILDFGDYLLDYMIVDLDSTLTFEPLYDSTGQSELYLPVLACFGEYIFETYSVDKAIKLYRKLSGDRTQVDSYAIDSIQAIMGATLGKDWAEIKTEYAEFLSKYEQDKAGIAPGKSSEKTENVLIDSDRIKLTASDDFIQVECKLNKPDSQIVTILIDKVDFPSNYFSGLYHDQMQAKNIENFRYCIRVDKNEIGLYDYALDRVLAKFINNRGLKNDYFDSQNGVIKAYFNKDYLDPSALKDIEYKIIK